MWCVFLVWCFVLADGKARSDRQRWQDCNHHDVSSSPVCVSVSVSLFVARNFFFFFLLFADENFCKCLHFMSPMFKWTDFVVLLNCVLLFLLHLLCMVVHTWHHQKLSCSLRRIMGKCRSYALALTAHCIPSSLHTNTNTHTRHSTPHMTLITQLRRKKESHKWRRWLKLNRK